MPFRLQGKHLFLTYPRCDSSKEDLLTFLNSKLSIEHYVIAQEQHQDGGLHLHAIVSLTSRCDIRNERLLDFGLHHPNLQVCRSPLGSRIYVSKHGNVLTNVEVPAHRPSWGDLRRESTTQVQYLQAIEKHYPEKAALNWDRLTNYANQAFKTQSTPYEHPYPNTEWHLPGPISDWLTGDFMVISILLPRNTPLHIN